MLVDVVSLCVYNVHEIPQKHTDIVVALLLVRLRIVHGLECIVCLLDSSFCFVRRLDSVID